MHAKNAALLQQTQVLNSVPDHNAKSTVSVNVRFRYFKDFRNWASEAEIHLGFLGFQKTAFTKTSGNPGESVVYPIVQKTQLDCGPQGLG